MAKQTSLYLQTGHNATGTTFTSADTTTKKTIFTPGTNDSDLKSITLTTDDTTLINAQIWYYDGSTSFLIGTVRVAVASGTDGAANAVDGINSTALPFLPIDDAGKRYLPVKGNASHVIQLSCKATMTGGKTLYVTCIGEDY